MEHKNLDSFLKQVLVSDELYNKAKALCQENDILDLNTLLELTTTELESMKLSLGIIKKIQPHLKLKCSIDQASELNLKVKAYKVEIDNKINEYQNPINELEKSVTALKQELAQKESQLKIFKENQQELIQVKEQLIQYEKLDSNNFLSQFNSINQSVIKLEEKFEQFKQIIQIDFSNDFLNESILVKNSEEKKILKQWLPNINCKTKLLFRGSRDGFEIAKFHQLCDNKGPTLAIIKQQDYVNELFGGYTPIPWTVNNNGRKDSSKTSFLFNLTNKLKFEQINEQNDAVWHSSKSSIWYHGKACASGAWAGCLQVRYDKNQKVCYSKIDNQTFVSKNNFESIVKDQQSINYDDYEVFQILN